LTWRSLIVPSRGSNAATTRTPYPLWGGGKGGRGRRGTPRTRREWRRAVGTRVLRTTTNRKSRESSKQQTHEPPREQKAVLPKMPVQRHKQLDAAHQPPHSDRRTTPAEGDAAASKWSPSTEGQTDTSPGEHTAPVANTAGHVACSARASVNGPASEWCRAIFS